MEAAALIERLKAEGKLRALPIGPVNWSDMTVSTFDGRIMTAYGSDGTWVEAKPLEEGSIRYLGSASHAGKIEFKSLYVFAEGLWHNILNGKTQAPLPRDMPFASQVGSTAEAISQEAGLAAQEAKGKKERL